MFRKLLESSLRIGREEVGGFSISRGGLMNGFCGRGFSSDETRDDGKRVSMTFHKGLPHLTIPMQSRSEDCIFVLRPISQNIGDFIKMLKTEDLGIDRAVLRTSNGTRISSTAPIKTLLDDKFELVLNDKSYMITPPKVPPIQHQDDSYNNIDGILAPNSETDLALFNDIRARVSQLYGVLHIDEYISETEKNILSELEIPRQELALMEPQYHMLSDAAVVHAKSITFLYLGGYGISVGALYEMTFNIYSWDIVEPISYFIACAVGLHMYHYFITHGIEHVHSNLWLYNWKQAFSKKAKRVGFDIQRYNELIDEIEYKEAALKRLREIKKYGIIGSASNLNTV